MEGSSSALVGLLAQDRNTGIMEEPPLSIYMQDWHAPDPHLKNVPGKWRGEIGWPPGNVAKTTLYLYDAHVLSTDPAKPAVHELRYVPRSAWKLDSGGENCLPTSARWTRSA